MIPYAIYEMLMLIWRAPNEEKTKEYGIYITVSLLFIALAYVFGPKKRKD